LRLQRFGQREIRRGRGSSDVDVAGGVEGDCGSGVNAFTRESIGEEEITGGIKLRNEDVSACA